MGLAMKVSFLQDVKYTSISWSEAVTPSWLNFTIYSTGFE